MNTEDVAFRLRLHKLVPETLIYRFGGRHTATGLIVGPVKFRNGVV
jgi:hypothetical protein